MRRATMRFMAVATGLILLASSQRVRAEVIINVDQVGRDVVATGSGTINLTDLTYDGNGVSTVFMLPATGTLYEGGAASVYDFYTGITGPSSFGSGGGSSPFPQSGDDFGVAGDSSSVALPAGYVSGASLSAVDTYTNATFSSLGLTPGTYTYSWGTGADADSLVVQIGPTATSVPLPASATAGFVLIGALGALKLRGRGTAPSC